VYQKQLNDWYETNQTAVCPKEGCIGKLDRCNNQKNCGKLPEKETVETPVTSTFFVSRLSRIKNLLDVEKVLAHLISCDI
jgi:hypothetical protein